MLLYGVPLGSSPAVQMLHARVRKAQEAAREGGKGEGGERPDDAGGDHGRASDDAAGTVV